MKINIDLLDEEFLDLQVIDHLFLIIFEIFRVKFQSVVSFHSLMFPLIFSFYLVQLFVFLLRLNNDLLLLYLELQLHPRYIKCSSGSRNFDIMTLAVDF